MKMHFLLLLSLLFFCIAADAQATYEKNFGGLAGAEWQNDIKEMRDGGYLVTGSTFNSEAGNYDAYCIKLNEAGEMLWSKTYGTSLSEADTKSWGTSDSGFVLLFSSHYPQSEKDSGVFVVKCNKDGNIQWSKFIKNVKAVTITPEFVYQSKDGDYYILCDWYDNFFQQEKFTLLKLDATGHLRWKKSINAQTPLASYSSSKIFESDRGDIMVVGGGSGDDYNSVGGYTHLFLFSSKNGTVKISKQIGQFYRGGYTSYLYAYNFSLVNNKLYANGYYSEEGFYSNICWFSLGLNDTQVQASYMAEMNFHSFQYLINKNIIKQPEGGFNPLLLFTKDKGYLYSFSSDHNGIWVNKYDSLGRLCPKFKTLIIDTTVHETTFDIADKSYSLINDSLIITDYSLTVTDVTAQKIICSGGAPLIEKKAATNLKLTVGKLNIITLHLYPNPARDFINVNFEVSKASTIQFNIINAEGKSVLTKQVFASKGQQQINLNVQSLPAGIYYVKITGLDKPTDRKFLKAAF